MIYLLDTNVCVHVLRKRGSPLVRQRVAARPPTDLTLCSIVTGELYHGAAISAYPASNRVQVDSFIGPYAVLPFGVLASQRYADIRAGLEAQGLIIGDADMMIAAIASVHGLKIVTHNTKDFGRIPGLDIEDWEAP
jgi:tRNA(fMet)-specific endonuclease VapC